MPRISGSGSATDADPLARLNERQREVAEHGDGPLLVLAGAGTGKTSALTGRLTRLLRSGCAQPGQVLAVTFTNKAAGVMRERVRAQAGPESVPHWLGTFHALAARMLRMHASEAGLGSDYSILDATDSRSLLGTVAADLKIDSKRWNPRVLAAQIDRWKNRALDPSQVPAEEAEGFADGKGGTLYANYQRRMREMNAADFGDLLLLVVRAMQANAAIAERYRSEFQYILVDEYQDTNAAQYLWLRLVTGPHDNLCCVGDDDQAIYGWRGAQVGHILRFEEDFPQARVIRLEQNYRSTSHILNAGSGLIAANPGRLGKTLWSDLGAGEPVRIGTFETGRDEVRWIVREVESLAESASRKRLPLDQIAVLVRASFLMREFETQLNRYGIAYRVVGGTRFFDRLEVRDAIAYLQAVAQPTNALAFARAASTPRRGLGSAAMAAIRSHAGDRIPLHEAAAAALEAGQIRGAGRKGLGTFLDLLARWRALYHAGITPSAFLGQILEDSGYLAQWQRDRTNEHRARIENLQEFQGSLDEFGSVEAFLEHIALVQEEPEDDSGEPQLNLMTIHAAKGLEFDAVFLAGWEEDLLPSARSIEETGDRAVEEERRLAHVAITRARRHLAISWAQRRFMFNRWADRVPSRFLNDIPRADVAHEVFPSGTGSGAFAERSLLEHRAARVSAYRSPGWARLQANRAIATSNKTTRVPKRESNLTSGMRVFHEKFGYGEVKFTDGDRATVAFATGDKTIMSEFLKPDSGG